MDQLRLDTSTRIAVTPPPPTVIEWWSDSAERPRHAFPRRDGFPPSAVCGQRWTTRYGFRHAAGWCEACITALRDQAQAATAALALVEAADLAAGDHHIGVGG